MLTSIPSLVTVSPTLFSILHFTCKQDRDNLEHNSNGSFRDKRDSMVPLQGAMIKIWSLAILENFDILFRQISAMKCFMMPDTF